RARSTSASPTRCAWSAVATQSTAWCDRRAAAPSSAEAPSSSVAGSRRGVCYTRHAMTPRYPLASVDHALRIIEMLRAQPAMRLSDVARELGVANSTAHRLLSTLAHRGFIVQQQGTRRYLPGPALLDIGRSALLLSQ